MQYSNLKDEEQEERPRVSKKINISTDDLLKKKESYWFLALIVTLITIGTVIFFCAHTGGDPSLLSHYNVSPSHSDPPQLQQSGELAQDHREADYEVPQPEQGPPVHGPGLQVLQGPGEERDQAGGGQGGRGLCRGWSGGRVQWSGLLQVL